MRVSYRLPTGRRIRANEGFHITLPNESANLSVTIDLVANTYVHFFYKKCIEKNERGLTPGPKTNRFQSDQWFFATPRIEDNTEVLARGSQIRTGYTSRPRASDHNCFDSVAASCLAFFAQSKIFASKKFIVSFHGLGIFRS